MEPANGGKPVKCPSGNHLVFLWTNNVIVPHMDNYGQKCIASQTQYVDQTEQHGFVTRSDAHLCSRCSEHRDAPIHLKLQCGPDSVIANLVAALRAITNEVWETARESFDTGQGQAEQDFHESDEAGFTAWFNAVEALRVYDEENLVKGS